MNDDPRGIPGPSPDAGKPGEESLERRIDALAHLAHASVLNPSRRVYVNRTLRFDQIQLVGFDMDYTLAVYRKRRLEELSFELTIERLIEKFGYPEDLRGIVYDPSFAIRGVVVDKKEGNLFKMDRHRHVGRVYHGRRRLTKDERRKLYRNVKIRLKSKKYHWIDTLFAVPEAVLYADLVDRLDARDHHGPVDYWKLFEDIRAAIDEIHRDDTLKRVVKARVADFVRLDPDLPRTLHRLRSSGKRLFVLTNSYWDYTDTVMRHLLDGQLPEYPSWRQYFDFIVVGSKKPSFFTEDRPFFEVDPSTGHVSDRPATRLDRQHVYESGSLSQFQSILGSLGEEVLYVGDHIYGDIIRSKKDSLWRTALIIPELGQELNLRRGVMWAETDLIDLEERQASLEDEITQIKLQVGALEQAADDPAGQDDRKALLQLRRDMKNKLDQDRRDLRTIIDRRALYAETVDSTVNPVWGSLFKEGGESSAFARQVENYACVYTSKVTNFLYYSPQQYFRAPRHWLPHEKL